MQPVGPILQEAGLVSPSITTDTAFRKTTRVLPARHGLWAHTDPFRNLELSATLTVQFHHRSVTLVARLAAALVPGFDESQLSGRFRDRRLPQFRAGFDLKLLQRALNRFREIAHEVIPVGDLHGGGSTLVSSFGIKATTVPSNDLDSPVLSEPVGETRSRADRKQINDPSPFQIHQHRPVPLPLPPSPIIYTQHSDLRLIPVRRGFNPPQHRVAATHDAQAVQQSPSRQSAQGIPDPTKHLTRVLRFSRPGSHHARQTLGENLRWHP